LPAIANINGTEMRMTDLTTNVVFQATVSVLHRGWLYEALAMLNKPINDPPS